VIFTSDNGSTHPASANPRFHVGGADPPFFNSVDGLRGWKGSVYEGGIRVPLIARLPGRIPTGTVNDSPCYFADWFPTLCEATGLTVPDGLDGVSFWAALISGRTLPHPRPMVWVFPEYGGQVAVRIGDFKVVRQKLATKNPGSWEVYHLKMDRGESNDLAASSPELITEAIEILKRETSDNPVFPIPIPGVTVTPEN
jgi:arylsulfatase A